MKYLAIPYTWNPDVSFDIVNRVAADLMAKGDIIFSPISHSHCIADHLEKELRIDQDFWMHQDLPMVALAEEVIVVVINGNMDLVLNSQGVQTEIEEAHRLGLPVTYYHYDIPEDWEKPVLKEKTWIEAMEERCLAKFREEFEVFKKHVLKTANE